MIGDIHKKPGQLLGSMCLMCVHYEPADQGYGGRPTCPAFPNGIPEKIFYGEEPWLIPEPHLEPEPGQQGDVVFEATENVTPEMVQEWDGFRAQLLIMQTEESTGMNFSDPIEEPSEGPDLPEE